jgi:hypothetical protein
MKKIDSVIKISGAIGKQIVFKQYKDGQVVTKFPDMSRIIASAHQRKCRSLFKEAVAYAKDINNDPEKKKAYKGKTRKNQTVYNAAISEYMKRVKKEGR